MFCNVYKFFLLFFALSNLFKSFVRFSQFLFFYSYFESSLFGLALLSDISLQQRNFVSLTRTFENQFLNALYKNKLNSILSSSILAMNLFFF